jgi:hypothetical protein
MTKMMDDALGPDYKVGIVSEWELKPEVTDEFLSEIWKASTEILPKLEVQVVIDNNDRLHISSGTAGYVDFQVDPVGMKLPIKCWIHTHPFGSAYFSGTDISTVSIWEPMMNSAIVLGGDAHYGHWTNRNPKQLVIYRNHAFERVQSWADASVKPNNSSSIPIDYERLREILLDYDFITEHELINAEELLRLEQEGEE